MTILYHFYLFSALLEPGALREDGGVLGKLVVRETWPWIEAKMYLKRGGWDKLKLKWKRVTCVLKMGWQTHLLESCHWHWHATHWRATQSSNEASFHLPPPLGHCHHLADRTDDISCSSLQVLRRRPPGGRTGFKVSICHETNLLHLNQGSPP